MAGTACHLVFIVKYALPYRHPVETLRPLAA